MVSAKSRTSSPRWTVIWRSALAWFQAEISRIPAAVAVEVEPELGAEVGEPVAGRVDRSSGSSPASRCGGIRPSTRCASVTVGSDAAPAVAQRPGVGTGRARPDLAARPPGRARRPTRRRRPR